MKLVSVKDLSQVSVIPMTIPSPLHLTMHGITHDMSKLGSFCGLSMTQTNCFLGPLYMKKEIQYKIFLRTRDNI